MPRAKAEHVDLRLPPRMRKQLATLSKSLGESINTVLVRLVQERLEVAELWPPPYDDSHLHQPRRVLAPNPRSVYTRDLQDYTPIIIEDPETLAFLEEAKRLASESTF
jgi:hypothetical protein